MQPGEFSRLLKGWDSATAHRSAELHRLPNVALEMFQHR
jgi:hypothetical protein